MLPDKAEQLQRVAYEYHRARGFPYPKISPVDRWRGLYEIAEAPVAVLGPQRSLFKEMDATVLELNGAGTDVANSFHRHIWESQAIGMRSPVAAFNDEVALRAGPIDRRSQPGSSWRSAWIFRH